MSVVKPAIVIEFGSRRVAFYPLQLKHMKSISMPETVNASNIDAAYASIMNMCLLSAQRGDPTVTMEDIELLIDMDNRDEVLQAITGRKKTEVSSDPTSPHNGGTYTATSSPAPAGRTQ